MHVGHTKVEVNPLVTFFVPGGRGGRGGHTLFGRMQTPRLMDGHPGCFPRFRFIREMASQPLGAAGGRAGLLFGSGLDFSWIQDAMKRLRVQLSWQSSEERWSLPPATAVLSPDRTKAIYGAIKNTGVSFFDA